MTRRTLYRCLAGGGLVLLAVALILLHDRSSISNERLPDRQANLPTSDAGTQKPEVGLSQLPRVETHSPVTTASGAGWNWRTEMRALASEDDSMKRSQRVEALAAHISDKELSEVLDELMQDETAGVGAELRSLLVRRWAGRAPAQVAAWLASCPENAACLDARRQLAIVWANADLTSATAWAKSLAPGDSKTAALVSISYEAARSDLRVALDLAVELPAGAEQEQLLTHCSRQWAAMNPAEAFQWAEKIKDNSLREQLLANIAVEWAEQDAVTAGTVAVSQLAPGKLQEDSVVQIVQRWAQSAPDRAAAWVEGFSEGRLRDAAMQNLAALWAKKDPAQAAAWLTNVPPGHSRDVAVMAFASELLSIDRSQASRWAATISNPEMRTALMERIAGSR
jgi:hypothetical protein